MNGAHLHLILNHLPIVGTYLSLLVLAFGFFRKNTVVQRTGLSLMVLSAILAVPAFLTGEPAEDILEAGRFAGKSVIETHEEMAEFAMWICEITGVLAAIALMASIRNLKAGRMLTLIALLASLVCSVMWFRVGNSGGEIRHTEIRSSQQNGNADQKSEDGEQKSEN